MSAPHKLNSPNPPSRLAIIHFLGWMAGIAIALAFYREFTDWSEFKADEVAQVRLWHLALGLAYGTALTGLGLVLWRRVAGGLPFPAQPGHWLLVLSAAGFVLDGATLQITKGMQWAGWLAEGRDPRYYAQLSLNWFTVLASSLAAMLYWTKIGRWRWLAIVVALIALCNGTTHLLAGLFFYSSFRPMLPFPGGNWPFFVAMWSRAYGTALCLPVLWMVAYADRANRDWLHWAGVAVASLLGVIELTQVVAALVLYG